MKKYFIFISVLIIVIGFFVPLIQVHAVMIEDIEIPEEPSEFHMEGMIDLDSLLEDCTLAENKTKPECVTPVIVTPPPPAPGPGTEGDYILLEPIRCPDGTPGCPQGGELTKFDTTGTGKLGIYLNILIKLFIGLCAVAAVVMIVVGGVEWSTSELVSTKAAAKERIQGAIFGLILALGSYTLLFTINPDLLNTDVDISGSSIVSEGELLPGELAENVPASLIGPGTIIDGKLVKLRPGAAVNCTGGLVTIDSNLGLEVNSEWKNTPVCSDLLSKLVEVKKIFPYFKISSTVRDRNADSNCHFSTKGPQRGNCADLVVTNGDWSGLCRAIRAVGDLNFLNEVYQNESTQACKDLGINPKKKPKNWSGNNIHVNFIGGGGAFSSQPKATPNQTIICIITYVSKPQARISMTVKQCTEFSKRKDVVATTWDGI